MAHDANSVPLRRHLSAMKWRRFYDALYVDRSAVVGKGLFDFGDLLELTAGVRNHPPLRRSGSSLESAQFAWFLWRVLLCV